MTDLAIADNPAEHRYEAHTPDGTLAAWAEYNLVGPAVMFTHTEVVPAFEGQGVGSKLARAALDDARRQGKQVIPVCQFFAGWLRKHRDYLDLVEPRIQRAFKI